MNAFKTTEELYTSLVQFLTYHHSTYKYSSEMIIDIIELSDIGNARNFLRNRYSASGNGYVLSYAKARTMKDTWRMYIHERSA